VNPRVASLLAGVGLLIVAAMFTKLSIVDALNAAEAGARVTLSDKSLLFLPFAAAMGVFSLITGIFMPGWTAAQAAKPRRRFGEHSLAYKASVIAVVAVLLGVGLALRLWVRGRLAQLGYPQDGL
jgi:hypothetical protein